MADQDDFIKDVIYGLKVEYGKSMLVGRWNGSMDPKTGLKSFDRIVQKIPKGIPLPTTIRQQFFRSLGVQKAGNIEYGDREILLDNSDFDLDFQEGDFLVYKNFFGDVKTVEKFDVATVLTVKEVKNRPIIQDAIYESEVLSMYDDIELPQPVTLVSVKVDILNSQTVYWEFDQTPTDLTGVPTGLQLSVESTTQLPISATLDIDNNTIIAVYNIGPGLGDIANVVGSVSQVTFDGYILSGPQSIVVTSV